MSDEPTQDAPAEPAAAAEPAPASEPAKAAEPAKATKAAKRKKREGEPTEPTRLPGAGTADGDKLRDANAAFEAGNYALVRTLTRELERAGDPKVVDAARDLARRTAMDPVQIGFLVACLIALLYIAWVYILR